MSTFTPYVLTYHRVASSSILSSRTHSLDIFKTMASLLELLYAYPILETLAAVLPLGDLFNLSKTNSTCRALLHGFSVRSLQKPSSLKAVRPALFIGRHNNSHWKNLKAKSPLFCSEPQHTRGAKIKGCLMCSMPVCEACVIKASFGKRDENTFPNRMRSLCDECFSSGNPHKETSLKGDEKIVLTSYAMRTECICTAKDGHLCLRCKTKQNSSLKIRNNQCYGTGCPKSKLDGLERRVCLWCDLPLPRERSRAESRRDYDARHLLARTHSSYDQPLEERAEHDIIDAAEQGTAWASSTVTSASQRTNTSKKASAVSYDRFEDERRRELEMVSQRRQSTVSAPEEERWRRSEAVRRFGDICRAPPPTRITTRLDSTASTLAPEADLSPPSYDICTRIPIVEAIFSSPPPRR